VDFQLTPGIRDCQHHTKEFVAEHILPLEQDPKSYDEHENIRLDLLEQFRDKAKQAATQHAAHCTEQVCR
jgi:acyl-CoA dehydrogenase